jgi:uncharacterized protein YqeY
VPLHTVEGERMILDKLTEDMKRAMKHADKTKLSVVRMLRGELKNARIATGRDLLPQEEEKVLMSYAKKRKESIEQYREAGREDLAEKERKEYDITMSYLPPPMNEGELRELIEKHIESSNATGMKEFGAVMKAVMAEVGSRVAGSEVSAMLKQELASKESAE